jgi:glycosyltransferase involved in cell wall biosynthesis
MKVLVFHGYLLRGTGSNVYNASLAQALCRLGHEVHLLCQDRAAAGFDWVHGVGEWASGRLRVRAVREPDGEGSVTVYVPDIGGLLPVYVADRYEEFEAKTFPELTDRELDRYVAANVAAVAEVSQAVGGANAALANHLVMGPAILARAGIRGYAVKIHGSALEYTVKPHPRFLPFAREGIEGAAGVLVGSRHTAESLWEALGNGEIPARTRLGPPGVDVERFGPRPRSEAGARVNALAARIASDGGSAGGFGTDEGSAADALRAFAGARGPRVLFVGKLIVSKGVDLLLAAWPLVHARNPGARLLIVGFGAYREALESLAAALTRADFAAAGEIAVRGRALEGGERSRLHMLDRFLASTPAGYAEAARAAAGSVDFSGRLEHDDLADVMPAADALVFPSTFPESFGMVAVEAAACGALPVSAGHSGLAEVSLALAAAGTPRVAPLLSFPLGEGAVASIADRLNRWLALDPADREREMRPLVAEVRQRWSWEGVARGVIAASQGRLDDIPRVPGTASSE